MKIENFYCIYFNRDINPLISQDFLKIIIDLKYWFIFRLYRFSYGGSMPIPKFIDKKDQVHHFVTTVQKIDPEELKVELHKLIETELAKAKNRIELARAEKRIANPSEVEENEEIHIEEKPGKIKIGAEEFSFEHIFY